MINVKQSTSNIYLDGVVHPTPLTYSNPSLHVLVQPLSLHSAVLSGMAFQGEQHLVRHIPLSAHASPGQQRSPVGTTSDWPMHSSVGSASKRSKMNKSGYKFHSEAMYKTYVLTVNHPAGVPRICSPPLIRSLAAAPVLLARIILVEFVLKPSGRRIV